MGRRHVPGCYLDHRRGSCKVESHQNPHESVIPSELVLITVVTTAEAYYDVRRGIVHTHKLQVAVLGPLVQGPLHELGYRVLAYFAAPVGDACFGTRCRKIMFILTMH